MQSNGLQPHRRGREIIRSTKFWKNIWHDLFVLGLKRWGRWCAFLGTSQEEGMNQEEEGTTSNKEKPKANAI